MMNVLVGKGANTVPHTQVASYFLVENLWNKTVQHCMIEMLNLIANPE